jgi:branched-chain amino acid transport system ATP-binding protein
LKVSGRVLVVGHGWIEFEGTPDDLDSNAAIRSEWLEVCGTKSSVLA